MLCPCGSGNDYADCCQPVIAGQRDARTAEELMRARYSAYTQVELDFIEASLHPDFRDQVDPEGARRWAEDSEWHGLEIIATEAGGPDDETGKVEFIAAYTINDELSHYHEVAEFVRSDGVWYFTEGQPGVRKPITREAPKVGRNDPCPCGSGKKYKRCCGV